MHHPMASSKRGAVAGANMQSSKPVVLRPGGQGVSERRVAGGQVFTAGTQPLSFSAQEITSVPPLWLQASCLLV